MINRSPLILQKNNLPHLLPGWVWLCGAGPGDPGLLTLHAFNALQQANVIVYDALVNPEILEWTPDSTQKIYAGKRGGKPSAKQRSISLRLVELAQAKKRVLRLKGGDPFVFGRGGEEAQTLVQNNIPIRIIPGITAGIGGLAYAGIPVTHRCINQSVTFITGHDKNAQTPLSLNWQAISDGSQVLVIYMGLRYINHITTQLLKAGRKTSEPVAIVAQATTKKQHIIEITLGKLNHNPIVKTIKPPAIICIGRSVLMRQVLDWKGMLNGILPRNLNPLKCKDET